MLLVCGCVCVWDRHACFVCVYIDQRLVLVAVFESGSLTKPENSKSAIMVGQ